jgi:hypothetical protein
MGIQFMYLGPYQFKLAPVEHVFSLIKSRDLNRLNTRVVTRYETICIKPGNIGKEWRSSSKSWRRASVRLTFHGRAKPMSTA